MALLWLVLTLSYSALACAQQLPLKLSTQNIIGDDELMFPASFKFGSATASYQIEGAWNLSGKGESVWDHLIHIHPEVILDRSNGDVSVDSYHFYKDDVKALKEMGMDRYRFSISWPRVLPTGDISSINEAGIAYYVSLVDELLFNGIEPMVTLYHWDLPQYLQDLGGWTNPLIVDYFEEYARLMFTRLSSKVKLWITFNEPKQFCVQVYDNLFAPRLNSGVGPYLCAHHVLISHARVYRLYNETFKEKFGGKVGITLDSQWYEPATNASVDIQAAERGRQFLLGWYAHPIYSPTGGYPDVMVERIDANSKAEGRIRSRLPVMDEATKKYIRGTFDFFGLNHYTTRLTTPGVDGLNPSWNRDMGTLLLIDPSWPGTASEKNKVVPWGLGNLLRWIKNEYNNPELIITENGFADHGEINDVDRASYYCKYLNEVLKAVIEDGCNVTGYTAWSLVDNFEWLQGYTEKYGLHYVDLQDPLKKRVPKLSSTVMKEIIQTRKIPQKYLESLSTLRSQSYFVFNII